MATTPHQGSKTKVQPSDWLKPTKWIKCNTDANSIDEYITKCKLWIYFRKMACSCTSTNQYKGQFKTWGLGLMKDVKQWNIIIKPKYEQITYQRNIQHTSWSDCRWPSFRSLFLSFMKNKIVCPEKSQMRSCMIVELKTPYILPHQVITSKKIKIK